jgi:N-acetylglucosaminyldiphosphoundecaprenol N-acetyl-beta-D-mannosaminyltransferase
MQRSGLEWLFRLASEPRRLWRRYLRYPIFFLLLGAQLVGLRRFELEITKEGDPPEPL